MQPVEHEQQKLHDYPNMLDKKCSKESHGGDLWHMKIGVKEKIYKSYVLIRFNVLP